MITEDDTEKRELKHKLEVAHSTGVCTCDDQGNCPVCLMERFEQRAINAEIENVALRRGLHASQSMMRWIRTIVDADDDVPLMALVQKRITALKDLQQYKYRTEARLRQMRVELHMSVDCDSDLLTEAVSPLWVENCLRQLLEEPAEIGEAFPVRKTHTEIHVVVEHYANEKRVLVAFTKESAAKTRCANNKKASSEAFRYTVESCRLEAEDE